MGTLCSEKVDEKQRSEYASSDNDLNYCDSFIHAYCGAVLDLVVVAELKTDSLSLCENDK